MARDEEGLGRATVRRLWLPIYLPTALFAAGVAALAPVLPLLALDLGLGGAGTAALLTAAGALAVLAPLPAGLLVARIGERRALVGGALLVLLGDAACWAAAVRLAPLPVFLASVPAMAAGAVVWDLGRQGFLADEVPARVRPYAMNLFGGMQRLGRVIGPLAGTAVLALAGTAAAIAVEALACLIAAALVLRFVPRPAPAAGPEPAPGAQPAAGGPPAPAFRMRPMLLVSAGVASLELARSTRGVLVVLCAHAIGMDATAVSALFAVQAVIEIAFFALGARLMERFGRVAAIVVPLLGFASGFALLPLMREPLALAAVVVLMSCGNTVSAGINKTLAADLTPRTGRARYLGLWNSITGLGVVTGPGVVALLLTIASLPAAGAALAALLGVGAAWSAWWVPRLAPARAEGPGRSRPGP
ncbi:MAG: MFS transporter [Pseudoclavibacter sp.]|nr:MFS transporter [Pseudoclavibacter sp.]